MLPTEGTNFHTNLKNCPYQAENHMKNPALCKKPQSQGYLSVVSFLEKSLSTFS